MQSLTKSEVKVITDLRGEGCSISEIAKKTGRGKATISRYVKGVVVQGEYAKILKEKQGGSRERSKLAWLKAREEAKKLLSFPFSKREKLIALSSLYWAEGTKRELGFINSDASMIRMFVRYLYELGVKKEDLQISLRIFEDSDYSKVKKYWAKTLGIKSKCIGSINILYGKKKGKLPYGMCRVRVRNNAPYFKILMSMIQILGEDCNDMPL